MTFTDIEVVEHKGWGEIVLNRPAKMNAMRPETCFELLAAAQELSSRVDIKCVVFRAKGNNFSGGYDVTTELDSSNTKALWHANRKVQNAFAELSQLPAVLVCELKGYVVGLAIILAAVCDLRYATKDTVFYVPELDMGIPFSLGGVATLARYTGITAMADLVLNCPKRSAADPRFSTFITELVDKGKIGKHVNEVARRLGERPNSLILSSLTTIREAGLSLMPPPASDLFTMLYVDREEEAKSIRTEYSKRFKH